MTNEIKHDPNGPAAAFARELLSIVNGGKPNIVPSEGIWVNGRFWKREDLVQFADRGLTPKCDLRM